MPYYNTTSAAGRTLAKREAKAQTQAERILEFFQTSEQFLYTPSEVCALVFKNAVPLTSVRRAMTDLTTDRHLVKSRKMREGRYGHPEHCWHIRNRPPVQRELL